MDKRPGDRNPSHTPRRPFRPGASSPFVGRADEVRRLSSALSSATEGQGGTIFLTGQQGIGKTRLAREILALARKYSFQVLEGRAFPLEGGLAYAPILDAFGPLLRNVEASRLLELVNGLPDLGRLFAGLNLPAPEPLGDPALERMRLFEAVSRLLERLARSVPVALFVDDVHRADPATLELLHYLARGLHNQRVLLLIAYPEGNYDTSPALSAFTESLERAGQGEECILSRLEPDEVIKLVQGILGEEAPEDLIALLDTRAGGTPLFVEALVTALTESGDLVRDELGWHLNTEGAISLPRSVRRIILGRLGRLTPSDRRIVELVATVGEATPHAILRDASGLEDEALLESLRRLQAAGLVIQGMKGRDVSYSITHPLIQEVAYSELPEMARRHIHLAVVGAIERRRPDDVNRLARHYLGAGPEANSDRTLAILLSAGERARAIYANEDAARYYTAALAMVRAGFQTVGFNGHDEALLPWLLERLGEVWQRVGRVGSAVEAWKEALVEREGAGDVVAACRLHRQLAVAEWHRGHSDIANDRLQSGLSVMSAHEPCQDLADLHFERFHILSRAGDLAGAANTAEDLLSLASQLALPRAEAQANHVAAMSCLWEGNVVGARQRILHALRVAEEAQELAIYCRVHSVAVLTGLYLGDHEFIRHHAEHGLVLARRLGLPNMEILLRLRLAQANLLSGAWNESIHDTLEASAQARRVGQPVDLAQSLAQRAQIMVLKGQLAEAELCIAEARAALGGGTAPDGVAFGLIDIADAMLDLERGKAEKALVATMRFGNLSAPRTSPSGVTLDTLPAGLMLLAESQVAMGDAAGALETAVKIAVLSKGGAPYIVALASRAEGLARHALGQHETAMSCLARAHENFAALEMPFELARISLEQAAATVAVQPESAAVAARKSLAIFDDLGARQYVDRSRRLLRELGALPPATRRVRPSNVPLSAREGEIALLVAEGLTTPEIAHRLILSSRTVSNHLSRIYNRLGIGSRAALARYLSKAGLLQTDVEIR